MTSYKELRAAFDSALRTNDYRSMEELEVKARELGTVEGEALGERICGTLHMIDGMFADALVCFDKSVDGWTQLGRTKEIGQTLSFVGITHCSTGDLVTGLHYFERARALAVECGDMHDAAECLGHIGNVYYEMGDYLAALPALEEVLAFFIEAGEFAKQLPMYRTIGSVHALLGNKALAMEFFARQEELAHQLGNEHQVTLAMHCRAAALDEAPEHEESLELYRKCLARYTEEGIPIRIHDCKRSICGMLLNLERYAEAEVCMQELLNEPTENPRDKAQDVHLYAHFLFLKKDFKGARTSAHEALELVRAFGRREPEVEIQKLLLSIAQECNDMPAYIEHNNEVNRLTEEIRGNAITRQLAKLEMDKKLAEQQKERDKERALLFGALPKSIAERKLRGEDVSSDHFTDAAIMFADIVSFTHNTSNLEPNNVINLLSRIFTSFDKHCDAQQVVKVKTIGDSYMCFKADASASENAHALASVANAMQQEQFTWHDNTPIQFRIGIHIGLATAGVIGTDRLQYDVWGDTVNVASRMESTCEPGKTHITEQFANALSPLSDKERGLGESSRNEAKERGLGESSRVERESSLVEPRGTLEIKGKGPMQTYWLNHT